MDFGNATAVVRIVLIGSTITSHVDATETAVITSSRFKRLVVNNYVCWPGIKSSLVINHKNRPTVVTGVVSILITHNTVVCKVDIIVFGP